MRLHFHIYKREVHDDNRDKKTCRICGAVKIIKAKRKNVEPVA